MKLRFLRSDDYPGLAKRTLNANTNILIKTNKRGEYNYSREAMWNRERAEDVGLDDFSDLATNQVMFATTRGWKKGMDSLLEPPEGA